MMKITNAITALLLPAGIVLTAEQIAPWLGLLAIIIAIVVNVLSWRNKYFEKKKIEQETETLRAEELVRKEELRQLKSRL